MTATPDLVIVSSPLQLLNAAEQRRVDGRPADLVIIGDRAGGMEAIDRLIARWPKLWSHVRRHSGRPQFSAPALLRDAADALHRASLTRLAARLGPRKTLVFGDYRNVSQRALIEAIAHEKLVLVDDGSVAPQVAAARAGLPAPEPERFAPGWLRTQTGRALLGEKAPPAPKALAFFSIYGRAIRPALGAGDRLVEHGYDGLKADSAPARRADGVWLLGSNHAAAGICTWPDYRALILGGVAALRSDGAGRIAYRPHRGEDFSAAAALAREAGMDFSPSPEPVEIAYLEAEERPAKIVVVASSAADTLSVIDPALDIVRLAWPETYLRARRDHMTAVVAGHGAFNPRLRVLSPNVPQQDAGR